jgi:Outer membrane protein beta-barrel domain
MKIRNLILMLFALLFANAAFAQDYSRFDVFGEYSYLRFSPGISQLHSRSFNGGGGGFEINISQMFGIKGEFLGYGSTSFTTTFTSPTVTPHGTIPPGTYNSQGNMFTYLFGPVVRLPISKVAPFGEILFGGSNTNGYVNLTRAIGAGGGTIAAAPTQHPYTMAVGGGLDINLSRHFAFRPIEIDYLLTRYSNPITNVNNQNNFRYLAGVIYKF